MKKNYFKNISSFLLISLFFIGCQKDLKENPETDLQQANAKPKNECRMTNFTYPGGEYNYHYNNQGLCDEWNISDYGLFRQEYDINRRLAISKLYVGGDLIFTIHFFYEGKKVNKEIWYNGNTSEIYDEVLYTYNSKGEMVRMESFIGDYYTIMSYTAEGNNSSWDFFIGGSPYYSVVSIYTKPYKNPYLAVPGIEHGFPFINPHINSSKWSSASDKFTVYDENGDPIVVFDYDPAQTFWQLGQQNYPLSVTFYDLISEQWFPLTFEYENCIPGNNNSNARITQAPSTTSSRKINPVMLLKRSPSKSIKEQAMELRRQFRR